MLTDRNSTPALLAAAGLRTGLSGFLRDPQDHGAVVLAGHTSGHRDYPNGTPIFTSPLESIVGTPDWDLAMTLNSLYWLSTIHPDTITARLGLE